MIDTNTLRHCEERSDEAIQTGAAGLDCFASLAMTGQRLLQGDHAAPELLHATDIDIVFAHKGKPPVGADAHHRDAGRQSAILGRHDAGDDQKPAARIDAESAQLQAAAVEVLHQPRLARRLIDGESGDAVLAAGRDLPRAGTRRRKGAVGEIDELAVGMNVDRPGALRHLRLGSDSVSLVNSGARERSGLAIESVDVKLDLPLDRDRHPWLGRMEIEMPRSEAEPVAWSDGGEIAQHAVVEAKCLDRAGILGSPSPALLPRVTKITVRLSGATRI